LGEFLASVQAHAPPVIYLALTGLILLILIHRQVFAALRFIAKKVKKIFSFFYYRAIIALLLVATCLNSGCFYVAHQIISNRITQTNLNQAEKYIQQQDYESAFYEYLRVVFSRPDSIKPLTSESQKTKDALTDFCCFSFVVDCWYY